MLFSKTIDKSRGREISLHVNIMNKSRGIVQSDGRTLCPALAEYIGQKTPVYCDECIYEWLEQKFKEKSKRNSLLSNKSVLMAILLIVSSIHGFFMHVEGQSQMLFVYLVIICMLGLYLILTMMHRKKTSARLTNVRRCIEQRESVTAYYFYISELCWCDTSDDDSISFDAYLLAENILFSVSYDMFNNVCPGDYFTAVVVDTGSEKLLYIVDYR